MTTNVDATETKLIPDYDKAVVYFTGAKAAQNDTITLTGATVVYEAQVMINEGSDWVVDTFTVDQTTINMINLTGAETGTVHGFAVIDV